MLLTVAEEGSDPAHRAAVRIWALILPGSMWGKGWDRSDVGWVVADVEPSGPALMAAAVKPLATCQGLPALSCHQEEGQDPCNWKAMEERRAATNANSAQLVPLFQ